MKRHDLDTALPRRFYGGSILSVAEKLVGHYVVRDWQGEQLLGRIVEVEAYGGLIDPSSHSFKGPTDRCRTMFGAAGHAYVYFIYGTHYCLNVIAGHRRWAGAILIRALQPLQGIATMRQLRAETTRAGRTRDGLLAGTLDCELTNGPGKLAAALALNRDWDGHDLTHPTGLWLSPGEPSRSLRWSPRIGLGRNAAAPWHWRCFDAESPAVSRVPKSWPTSAAPHPSLEGAEVEYPPKVRR